MRRIFLIMIVLWCFVSTYPQSETNVNSQYLFKEFTKGHVLFRSGLKTPYFLNFNMISEQVIFKQEGQYLDISNPEIVDTVYIQNKKFIYTGKLFYEIAISWPRVLCVEHKCLATGKAMSSVNTSSGTFNTNTTMIEIQNSVGINNPKLPEDSKLEKKIKFWIKKGPAFYPANSAKQIAKIYPARAEYIKQFAKKNKTNFKNQEDVEKLILSLD